MNRAVFLDRDGTMARDIPYCSRPEDFELFPEVARGIRLINQHNFKVVVITNQSGIARGYFTEEMLHRIHQKMSGELVKDGAFLDAIYYCPHHPDDNCECRKPGTGMLERAAEEMSIDLSQSYLIGDKQLDVTAAKKAGCNAILIHTDSPGGSSHQYMADADFMCHDFYSAAAWIIADSNLHERG